jgi:hypothetical protein
MPARLTASHECGPTAGERGADAARGPFVVFVKSADDGRIRFTDGCFVS